MGNRSNEDLLLIKAIITAIGITIISNFIFTFWHEEIPSWVQDFAPLLGFIPFILLPILIVLYLIAAAKHYLEPKILDSKAVSDVRLKMGLLDESTKRIEKKLDNIEKILEKVSE